VLACVLITLSSQASTPRRGDSKVRCAGACVVAKQFAQHVSGVCVLYAVCIDHGYLATSWSA
jgi:hypothetical protein